MSTPKPGQIRCPTCHGSTPPAAFCTQCGAPIPASARARPRGLDREELEERLRARRPEDVPYRRGSLPRMPAEEIQAEPFQTFEPEPEDSLARRAPAGEPVRNVDNLPPGYDQARADERRHAEPAWPDQDRDYREPAPLPPARPDLSAGAPPDQQRYEPTGHEPTAYEPTAYEPTAYEQPVGDAGLVAPSTSEPPPPEAPADDEYLDDDYDYPYDYPSYDEPRRSGAGPLMIVGFAALGLAALLAGVLLSGLFGPGAGVAADTPTPSATPSIAVEATPTPGAATPGPSSSATSSDGPPVAFDDGFTASAQPCADEPASNTGCDSSGAQIAVGDKLWVWIGFSKGTNDDVLGITLVDAGSGEAVADASYELAKLGAQSDRFNGWLKFPFSGLAAGSYEIRISRNGAPAAVTPFTVSG